MTVVELSAEVDCGCVVSEVVGEVVGWAVLTGGCRRGCCVVGHGYCLLSVSRSMF